MISSWTVQLGELEIFVHIGTPDADSKIGQLCESLQTDQSCKERWYLIIFPPHLVSDGLSCIDLPERDLIICERLNKLWSSKSLTSQTPIVQELMTVVPGIDYRDWFLPELMLLRYQKDNRVIFFSFLNQREYERLDNSIFRYVYFLATWWHTQRKGLILHAAAVADNSKGYLFLGEGGAGKSTVASLSDLVGLSVLSDDLAIVITNEVEGYNLISAPSLSKATRGLNLRPSLSAFFRLVKDSDDRLISLSKQTATQILFQSFTWNHWTRHLPPMVNQFAFHTACTIARTVPGYELHFRKSPDFWKVIDAEFGL
jgi:hypothetical protein